jgi:hypothetical protein
MKATVVTPRSRIVARAVTFALVAGWIWFGPFYRQVLHGRSPIFRPWVMFSGAGLTATEVRYVEKRADGAEAALDRFVILAPDGRRPRSIAYLKDADAVRRVGRQLCRKLGAGADVRATFRIAKRAGWKREMKGEENLCATP